MPLVGADHELRLTIEEARKDSPPAGCEMSAQIAGHVA